MWFVLRYRSYLITINVFFVFKYCSYFKVFLFNLSWRMSFCVNRHFLKLSLYFICRSYLNMLYLFFVSYLILFVLIFVNLSICLCLNIVFLSSRILFLSLLFTCILILSFYFVLFIVVFYFYLIGPKAHLIWTQTEAQFSSSKPIGPFMAQF